ncbi:Branched-chain amino acid transport system / permease component [Nonomuraea coxensis DSM 45129]|uniref:Branched-chain amino acid transport system / permease component n=1 Tax=Nonomuraea coxensis DSM 45129 TaxID=1122611 RepID=A0ABX8TT54_9ACTN|nr:ABC transporter permease [Nonomuraea coxensis]QYC38650.1 Branched-chain amino acid transport system / permease component [Nonomuraea coxensis DSM 45129]
MTRVGKYHLTLIGVAALLLLMSLVRIITGQNDITSSGTFYAALLLAVPIGLAGLGGLWAERAGVVNIGLEGMMVLGTWFAGWAGYQWGPVAALVAGLLAGAIGGLIHAVATVTFGVDHIISGVAINLLGPGATRFLSEVLYKEGTPAASAGAGITTSPAISGSTWSPSLPVLSDGPDLLGKLESTHWFLLSDLAGILRGLTHNVNILVLLAVLLLPLTYFVLWHTAFGLRLRSAGENPWAAESLGVNVYLTKYIAVVVSGAFAGLGGVFLVFVSTKYVEGQTAGRGFIGLAAMIFGNWRPGGLAAGAALFGYADGLQLRDQKAVTSFFLFGAVLLLAYLVMRARSLLTAGPGAEPAARGARQYTLMAAAALGMVVLFWLWLTVDELPNEFVFITPHVLTLLVLLVASQRLRMPKADGVRYRRGEQH